MYIERHLEKTVAENAKYYSVMIVTGARQVGKTTMLKRTLNGANYVTFDDPVLLNGAKADPASFLKMHSLPLFIDEIQYAPEILQYMKMEIDESNKKGLYFLSGSQQFHLMKNVSESLAGRIAVLNMLPLSEREISGEKYAKPFIPNAEFIKELRGREATEVPVTELWKHIQRGFMPQLIANPKTDWNLFYASYTNTYIERDIRSLEQISNESKFVRFITAAAARTAQLLNFSDLARDADISVPTAVRWLSLLQTSNIVCLVQPWFNNSIKRMLKTPKLYFLDTGLAAYLTGWNNAEVMLKGAMSGAFFETFVVSEILKSWYNAGITQPPVYYYRDKDGAEIDILIHANGKLYPVEIKKHAEPRSDDTKHFRQIDKIAGVERGEGTVISPYGKIIAIGDGNIALPVNLI